MIYTCYKGRNQDLIPEVAELYFAPGMKIADVTFGRGNFWRKIDIGQYDFYPIDILTGVDFRALPYPDAMMDAIVLDPPYVHNGGSFKINATYNNALVTGNFETVLQLYRDGIWEARRVLKARGMLLVKCQDIVEGRIQRWSHILIKDFAEEIGFKAVDLFILHQSTIPMNRTKRWGKQVHARRNHSYLWVLKPKIARS
jgi:hypothetical protein